MVDSIGIERVPTPEERLDYKQLGEKTPKQKFLKDLAKVEMTFIRQHKPFDSQCAKLDFADRLDNIEKESQRIHGYVREQDVLTLKFEKLEKYGDASRFTIEDDDVELEMQNVNNTKTAVMTGHTVKYVCKERGHGCSVFIPIDMYEERFNMDKKKTKMVEEE